MAKQKKIRRTELDLDAEAVVALEEARAIPHERTGAMKKAGILRNAVDLRGIVFAKRGRPAKT
jgi:hypothetical protein